MRTTRTVEWVANGLACLLGVCLLGCNTRPGLVKGPDRKTVTTVTVDSSNPEELAAVADFQDAVGGYRQALTVLQGYYDRLGSYDKRLWAEIELRNLGQAVAYEFSGVEGPSEPRTESVEQANEAALVERTLSCRRAFLRSLDRLEALYRQSGMELKLAVVRNMQRRFRPEETYSYLPDAEIPPATLKPTTVNPQAEELFRRAERLHHQGKPLPLITSYRKQRQALVMFRQLVEQYPDNIHIAEAAYYIAEIYKEYYKEQELRAVRWYERAWQWDPYLPKPARFQAAVIYDHRLHERAKAVELYKAVLACERFNATNVGYARGRIEELTGQAPASPQ